MGAAARYVRLYLALARYGLSRELAFRGNFLVKLFVEILWLAILLVFYSIIFNKTTIVAGWAENEYLFFLGCYFALSGLVEALFLGNCSEFSELIRNGDLDFILLRPIDEQFMVTCRDIDWAAMANVVMGSGLMGVALYRMPWPFDPLRAGLFLVLCGCGVALTYSFLLLLTSTSVWFTRNQSMYELWWLFTSLMRYPREMFSQSWAWPIGTIFTYIIPVMLVVNVPANTMVKALEPVPVLMTVGAAVVLVWASRRFFRAALRRYRSASS
jgi:ABC-2 type transport system permease protein